MSARTCSRTPGRCTFTTTSRPERVTARCTCPMDADASGTSSNSLYRSRVRAPRSASMVAWTSSIAKGSTPSCRRWSASV